MRHEKKALSNSAGMAHRVKNVVSHNSLTGRADKELAYLHRTCFVSKNTVESQLWKVDVFNFVADDATSSNQPVPSSRQLKMHVGRASLCCKIIGLGL